MKKLLSLISAAMILYGCSSTQVMVNSPKVDIYIDNVNMGKGTVEIRRMGPPKRKQVVARYEGKTVGEMEIRRKFDVVTFFLGLYTYGVGLVLGWRYPSVIMVPIELPYEGAPARKNPWMEPPRIWGSDQAAGG